MFPDDDAIVHISAYLGADPTAPPDTWPTPVDLSERLLTPSARGGPGEPVTVVRGRHPNQRTLAAGSCSFVLDNSDGALTPLMATSPYYLDWDLGVPVAVDTSNLPPTPATEYPQFRGYVSSIEALMVPGTGGRNISAVRVDLGGTVQRLGQGETPKSALYRAGINDNPRAYWPLEDLTDSTSAGSGIGSSSMRVVGTVGWAEVTDLVGSEPNPTMTTGSMFGSVTGGSATAWHVEFFIKSAFTNTVVARLYTSSEDIEIFRIAMPDAVGQEVTVFIGDSIGATVGTLVGSAVTASFENVWHHIAITATQSGANVAANLYVDGVLEASGGAAPATMGRVTQFWANHLINAAVTSMAHILVGDTTTRSDLFDAMDGYVGETATSRVARVLGEKGIPHTPWSPAPDSDPACGPQPTVDTLAIIRDAETVGHGMLYETTDTWGIGYRPLESLYNQAAAMTVNLATYRTRQGTSADVLRPVRNDQRIRNEWTITRPKGSSATAKDDAHQARHGRYNDSAEVNVATDGQLPDEASWRVHEGTDDSLRYATMPVDLGSNPSTLLPAWLGLQLGDRIERTNHLTEHPSDPASLIVEGYLSQLFRRAWEVQLATEPASVYNIAEVGHALYSIAGSDSATTAEALDTTETGVDINCGAGPDWTYETDFDIFIGGQRMTVTAIAAMAGTFPNRTTTLTVTRSANGVVKSHSSGAAITFADQAYIGL